MSNSVFRVVGAGTTFLSPSDFYIQVNTSGGAVQIVLPKTQTIFSDLNNSNTAYNYIGIRFVDISNNASVNNITITGFETDVINGQTNVVLTKNGIGGILTLIGEGQWSYEQNSDGGVVQLGTGSQSSVRIDNGNTASGVYSTILGSLNSANANFDTISGGLSNSMSSCNGSTSTCAILYCNTSGTIGGGRCNSIVNCINPATLGFSLALGNNTISGGYCNVAGQTISSYDFTGLISIGGGEKNVVTGALATISGGGTNTISSLYGTIGGGYFNAVTGSRSNIGGGSSNTISACNSVISGGSANIITASGYFSSIGGGFSHATAGAFSTISGGFNHTINNFGIASTISGGYNNTISASYSGILGGGNNNVQNTCSMIVGSNITTDRDCTTFVNNLSIKNIPITAPAQSGAVWRNGTVLEIVP